MEREIIDLYTLQTSIRSALEGNFPDKLWVKAEISAIKSRSGGHCYLELSQSGDSGLVAKSSAIIWSSKFRMLSPYFQSVAGVPLQEGINVLVRVQVNYSQLYGFSLIIDDIDPEFTLGDKERERQATIERLKREGLLDRQKELEMTALPYRIAVVSAPDAAGYRDFMRHLHENESAFVFHTELFEAVMQGASAPSSISAAISSAASAEPAYDAVVVLRGGGAKLDLACFDDYEVAAAIARCPIPVLTAVGHDQDYHICDMVAWQYVKTPTALADVFLDIYAAEDQAILSYSSRLKLAFLGKIATMSSNVDLMESKLKMALQNKINALSAKVDVLEASILGADPRRILSRGYALVTDDRGVVLKAAKGKKPGDGIRVVFSDGSLDCEVKG